MLTPRWSHLVRHGLLPTALLGAAASTASAQPCDAEGDSAIAIVAGLEVSPKIRIVGGIEARACVNASTEAMLRLELGGGMRLIGGARARPFEGYDAEHVGAEAGLVLDRSAKLGAHLALTYGTHSAYAALQTHIRSTTAGDALRWSLLGGVAVPSPVPQSMTVEGRPLIENGAMLRPRVLARAVVRDRESRAARDHFISSAQLELSSVWAFMRLAAELSAIGAPAELVAAALDAADDEVRHAEQCGALAGGLSLAALPGHAARPRFTQLSPIALATLVAEAWSEGCLNETAAAEEARLAGLDAQGRARTVLAAIAADETNHAELSWRVLAWVASIAPALARETLASLPAYNTHESEPSHVDTALARHGVPTLAITHAACAHAAAVADARRAVLFG